MSRWRFQNDGDYLSLEKKEINILKVICLKLRVAANGFQT